MNCQSALKKEELIEQITKLISETPVDLESSFKGYIHNFSFQAIEDLKILSFAHKYLNKKKKFKIVDRYWNFIVPKLNNKTVAQVHFRYFDVLANIKKRNLSYIVDFLKHQSLNYKTIIYNPALDAAPYQIIPIQEVKEEHTTQDTVQSQSSPQKMSEQDEYPLLKKVKKDKRIPMAKEQEQPLDFSFVTENEPLTKKIVNRAKYTDLRIFLNNDQRKVKKDKISKDQLQDFAEKFAVDELTVYELYDKVNGNIESNVGYLGLEDFFTNQQDTNLWHKEDDEVLRNTKNKEELPFKILLRYKGLKRVKDRLYFKKIDLPFVL